MLEGGKPRFTIDGDKVAAEMGLDAVAIDRLLERRNVFLDAEKRRRSAMEGDLDVAEHAFALPVIGRQIHRLLRRSGAFDRYGRLGE